MLAVAETIDVDALYQTIILDRARRPRHGTRLACFDAEASGDNPMCGDRLALTLRRDSDGRIEAVGHESRGCAISLAAADLMADAVKGLNVDATRALRVRFELMLRDGVLPDDPGFEPLRALSGVHAFRSRIRCALLPWTALEAALGAGATKEIDGGR